MVKSPQSPTMNAINAAASIIHGIGPQKYASKAANAFFCFSTSALGPYFFKRSWTSASVKPLLSSVPSFATVSAIVGGAAPVASDVCMNNSFLPGNDGDL